MENSINYISEMLNIEFEDLFKIVVNSAKEHIFFKDRNSRFVYVNDALLASFGASQQEDIIGKSDYDFLPKIFADQTFNEEQAIMDSGIPLLQKLQNPTLPSGKKIWNMASKHPLYNSSGEIVGLWGISADITQQKTTEFQLESTNEKLEDALKLSKEMETVAHKASLSKSQFLANMSHEIRTPMNAIIGLSELMYKTPLSPKQLDYNKKITSSAKSLLSIINSILDYSKIEAGKMELESVPFNLYEVLNSLSSMLSLKAEQKGIELLFDVAIDVHYNLLGDPVKFTQVLINLVNNSLKFTQKGNITLLIRSKSLENHNANLHVEVIDTGIGMKDDQIAKLFKPFTQADASMTRQYGGTGLGLAISKEIIELMGGNIIVSSVFGKGSTFSFDLVMPYEAQDISMLSRSEALKDMDVLVVDDNEDARRITGELLESFGFNVSKAKSGEEAIEIINRDDYNPKLVLMDYLMPGLNGIDTIAKIKDLAKLKDIPEIMMVSAYGKDEIKKKAENIGVKQFIDKPINPSYMFDRISEMFNHKSIDKYEVPNIELVNKKQLDKIKGANILLAEDNEINQQVASEILASEGFKVDIVNNGQEALDVLKKVDVDYYDLVLMDIQMPVMDGREATVNIRNLDGEISNIPIVAMTAHALDEEKNKNLKSGMNDQVNKPIDIAEVLRTLIKYIKPKQRIFDDIPITTKPVADIDITIDGIDAKDGIKRVVGNLNLYEELLARFNKSYSDAVNQIKANRRNNKISDNEIFIHTIKGTSGNLGAKKLFIAAQDLEQACKTKTNISMALAVFEVEIEIVLNGIDKYFSSKNANKPDSSEKTVSNIKDVEDTIINLYKQLEDFSVDAQATSESLLEIMGEKESDDFDLVNININNLQYDDAIKELKAFAKKYNILLGGQ